METTYTNQKKRLLVYFTCKIGLGWVGLGWVIACFYHIFWKYESFDDISASLSWKINVNYYLVKKCRIKSYVWSRMSVKIEGIQGFELFFFIEPANVPKQQYQSNIFLSVETHSSGAQ